MVTKYDGRTNAVTIAGNVALVMAPSVADDTLKKVTVAEFDAGTAIQCNIREFNPSGSVQNRSEQFLCDTDQTETAGSTQWSIEPIVIQTGDPQADNALLDGLEQGSTVYLIRRAGLPHDQAAAAQQRVNVWRCEVALVEDAADEANADGKKFETKLHLAVKQYERRSTLTA